MNKIIKPKIIIRQRIYRGCVILIPIFFFWWLLYLCGDNENDTITLFVIYTLFSIIVFVPIYLITQILKRGVYTLYEDKVTSSFTGFAWLASHFVSIAYKDIKEISMCQGIFQRKFNVGTIKITTNATKEFAGFEIYNIENYQEVYDYLSKKIAEYGKQ
jgi:membrane protein YdbS with pleckstrin-like domain